MANDAPTPRVESVGFDDLIPIARRLNTSSDDLNSALKRIEDRLNELGIGVDRFVPIPDSREVVSDGRERQPEEWSEYQVGYDRLGDRWALWTRRAHFQGDPTMTAAPEDCWRFTEEKPLLRSSRELRIKAVAALPELLKGLKSEAEGVLQVVESARRLAGDWEDESLCDVIRDISRHARLGTHSGSATVVVDGDVVTGTAAFLLPAEGAPIVAFRNERQLTDNFASDLRIVGRTESGSFEIHCPVCYTRKAMTGPNEGWTLASPINEPVRIEYAAARPVKRVRVVLNNFDYECGDPVTSETEFTRIGTPMVVQLSDRSAEFRRRADYSDVHPLVCAGLLRSASLTEFSCEVLTETDEDLLVLANDVASVCTFASGASVSVAMLECLDADNRVVRRIVTQPVGSRYRSDAIVADFNLPRLFAESFETYVVMRRSELPWRKLRSYCGSLEDMPYLEQKFAALMGAIEFFMRTSLIEADLGERRVTTLDFNELIGETRKRFGWDIPKHYNSRDTTRLLRNAVVHGSETPTKDNVEFRLMFNKWRLFLFRRILIRLGYQGDVVSPHKGWSDSSAVNDFSEGRNSFDASDADSHPFAQFVKHTREHSKTDGCHQPSSESAGPGS